MNNDPLRLSGLEDIALTAPPPFWPPATGFWLLLAMVALVAAAGIYSWYFHRKANAYRRAGLVLLAEAGSRREIDIVLKRVGLAAFQRETVAPLYGDEWRCFLDKTCLRCNFSKYPSGPEQTSLEPYRNCAAKWIRYHKKTCSC